MRLGQGLGQGLGLGERVGGVLRAPSRCWEAQISVARSTPPTRFELGPMPGVTTTRDALAPQPSLRHSRHSWDISVIPGIFPSFPRRRESSASAAAHGACRDAAVALNRPCEPSPSDHVERPPEGAGLCTIVGVGARCSNEPPGADPHAGWCGEGRLAAGPYPIRGHVHFLCSAYPFLPILPL